MIRDQVFKLLHYKGNLNQFIMSPYFLKDEQKNEFFYKASAKALFYVLYRCYPEIRKDLMTKYLENPFNPMILVGYNQEAPNFDKLDPEDPAVKRTIYLDQAYGKFKNAKPILLCIGNPSSRKSTLLNDMLEGSFFEVVEDGSARLFHDGVDALFDSKEMPMGFHVLDVQGAFANNDHILIEKLLSHVPMTYLFVQINDAEYIT